MNDTNTPTKSIAIVTGGSRGIGAAISEKLGAQGFHVIVNYVSNESKAAEVVNKIIAAKGSAEAMRFDVSHEEEIVKAMEEIAKKGTLAVLVNNAGISEDSLILRMKKDSLDRTLQTNLVSAILLCREAVKLMMKQRTGSIIQVSSVVGVSGNAGQVAYSAAKAGMLGLTKSLAKEVASRKIRVNAIAPGWIETDMLKGINETQMAAITQTIPMGCLGSASQVAELVGFLAGPNSSYITGQVIGINGGLYI